MFMLSMRNKQIIIVYILNYLIIFTIYIMTFILNNNLILIVEYILYIYMLFIE